MGDWIRTTRESAWDFAPSDVKASVLAHCEEFNLGSILNDPIMCVETLSEKKKKGLFSSKEDPVKVTAILTKEWLVWVVSTKGTSSTLSARLETLEAIDYETSVQNRMIPDRGLALTGTFTGMTGVNGTQRVSAFIGLGDEGAAIQFKNAVFSALADVRKP